MSQSGEGDNWVLILHYSGTPHKLSRCHLSNQSALTCIEFRSLKSSYSSFRTVPSTENVARPRLASFPANTPYGPSTTTERHKINCLITKSCNRQRSNHCLDESCFGAFVNTCCCYSGYKLSLHHQLFSRIKICQGNAFMLLISYKNICTIFK